LNAALTLAREWALGCGAQAVLVIPADLPLVTPADIAAVLDLGRGSRSVVIVPDARGEGTNALLLRPPDVINFAFGPQSFYEHRRRDLPGGACVYRSPTLALDLDTPADWKQISTLDVLHLIG
jgi:2-phospho-L-lactate guanylyltransferase